MKKLILALLLVATVVRAETYKWTDKAGTMHFSESLGEVPATYRNSAQPIGMDTGKTTNTGPASSPERRQRADDTESVAPDMEGLKERMLNDEGIMALIRALQNDPEMRALLNDPAILRAVQAMDIATLTNTPAFMKLLNNPRVREIEKRVQQGGTR
jgi:Domain of unknown function (DUF4124)